MAGKAVAVGPDRMIGDDQAVAVGRDEPAFDRHAVHGWEEDVAESEPVVGRRAENGGPGRVGDCRDESGDQPRGPLTVSVAGAMDLAVDMAVAGLGIIGIFEDWLRPHLNTGGLLPVPPEWWSPFPGPFLYYSGRRLVPPPLRPFLDFINSTR